MNNLPIRARVLLLALAPLTIIALLISLHSSVNRIRDLNHALHDHGQAIARQLAPACEYGVFAGNRELLTRLVQAAVREQDVVRVTVNGGHGEVLAGCVALPSRGRLITAAFAGRLGRAITEPVIRLTTTLEKIRAGDLEQ